WVAPAAALSVRVLRPWMMSVPSTSRSPVRVTREAVPEDVPCENVPLRMIGPFRLAKSPRYRLLPPKLVAVAPLTVPPIRFHVAVLLLKVRLALTLFSLPVRLTVPALLPAARLNVPRSAVANEPPRLTMPYWPPLELVAICPWLLQAPARFSVPPMA